jgi:hypothetical protein
MRSANSVVAVRNGMPVYLQDVAEVALRRRRARALCVAWRRSGVRCGRSRGIPGSHPRHRQKTRHQRGPYRGSGHQSLEQLRGTFIPDGVEITITRNYGDTANDKAVTLIKKLVFRHRPGGAAGAGGARLARSRHRRSRGGMTLAITLFASWAWGFTLNRVSLFALIFSIGILVDDAIVVVENIHRHMQMGGKSLAESIPVRRRRGRRADHPGHVHRDRRAAADGLRHRADGALHEPDPDQRQYRHADLAGVAFVVTPWLTLQTDANARTAHSRRPRRRIAAPAEALRTPGRAFPARGRGRATAPRTAGVGILVLILVSVGLAGVQWVVLKMLPFDNKSEFQVVVDMPEGTALERTAQVLVSWVAICNGCRR